MKWVQTSRSLVKIVYSESSSFSLRLIRVSFYRFFSKNFQPFFSEPKPENKTNEVIVLQDSLDATEKENKPKAEEKSAEVEKTDEEEKSAETDEAPKVDDESKVHEKSVDKTEVSEKAEVAESRKAAENDEKTEVDEKSKVDEEQPEKSEEKQSSDEKPEKSDEAPKADEKPKDAEMEIESDDDLPLDQALSAKVTEKEPEVAEKVVEAEKVAEVDEKADSDEVAKLKKMLAAREAELAEWETKFDSRLVEFRQKQYYRPASLYKTILKDQLTKFEARAKKLKVDDAQIHRIRKNVQTLSSNPSTMYNRLKVDFKIYNLKLTPF